MFHLSSNKVLVIHIHGDKRGLPGGHMQPGELPDEALKRELYEECGVTEYHARHADFFTHHNERNGKIILAYVGETSQNDVAPMQNNLEGTPKWLNREEFFGTENIRAKLPAARA